MTWGYSNEAFKRLRKISSLPSVTDSKNDKPQPELAIEKSAIAYNFVASTASSPVTSKAPLLNVTATRTFSLVSTSSTKSTGNILLLTTNTNMLNGSQTTVLPSLASPSLSVSILSNKSVC